MARVIVTIGAGDVVLDEVMYATHTAKTATDGAHVHLVLLGRTVDVYGTEAEQLWSYLRRIIHDATGQPDPRTN